MGHTRFDLDSFRLSYKDKTVTLATTVAFATKLATKLERKRRDSSMLDGFNYSNIGSNEGPGWGLSIH